VLVGAAVAVTVLVEDRGDRAADEAADTEPLLVDQFCAEAATFRSFDELNLEDDEAAADRLRGLAMSARRLASLSPAPIAEDFDAVAGAFEAVAQTIDSLPPDDPQRLVLVTQRLDEELGAVQQEADRAGAYVDTWCGPAGTSATTATTVVSGPTDATDAPASATTAGETRAG